MAEKMTKKEISDVAKEQKAELVTTETTAVANVSDFAEFAGAGLENVSAQDINIPYVKFLQTSSPEVKKGNEKRIDGAEEGDIVVTGINKLYKVDETDHSTLNIATVQKVTFLTEWAPNRGGLVGHHSVAKKDTLGIKKTKNQDGKEILVLPNGNEVVETDYLICVAIPQDSTEIPYFCIIPAKQTQRSAVRQMYTQLMFDCQNVLPSFAFVYTVGSKIKANENFSWVVPTYTKVTANDLVDYVDERGILKRNTEKGKQIYEACSNLYKTLKAVGAENFLQRTNFSDYEEAESTDTNESAGEII